MKELTHDADQILVPPPKNVIQILEKIDSHADKLKREKESENCVVIIPSDHGDSF